MGDILYVFYLQNRYTHTLTICIRTACFGDYMPSSVSTTHISYLDDWLTVV